MAPHPAGTLAASQNEALVEMPQMVVVVTQQHGKCSGAAQQPPRPLASHASPLYLMDEIWHRPWMPGGGEGLLELSACCY